MKSLMYKFSIVVEFRENKSRKAAPKTHCQIIVRERERENQLMCEVEETGNSTL
jgi:hypothetical protein